MNFVELAKAGARVFLYRFCS